MPTVKTRIEADPSKIERFRGRLSESDHPQKAASFGNLSGLVDVAFDVASSALEQANLDRAQVMVFGGSQAEVERERLIDAGKNWVVT